MKLEVIVFGIFSVLVCFSCKAKTSGTQSNYCQTKNCDSAINKIEEDEFLKAYGYFWKEFREAIIKSDTMQLINLSHFPLTANGYLDWDPVLKISKTDFYKYIVICLSERTAAVDRINGTNLEHIIRIKDISLSSEFNTDSKTCNTYQRMGNFVFTIIEGKWKLTSIYIDTKGQ